VTDLRNLTTEQLLTFTRLQEYLPRARLFVSTVYLTDGKYETMVFPEIDGDPDYGNELALERYSDPKEALVGHIKYTARYRNQETENPRSFLSFLRAVLT
jgi:hypothetical protein